MIYSNDSQRKHKVTCIYLGYRIEMNVNMYILNIYKDKYMHLYIVIHCIYILGLNLDSIDGNKNLEKVVKIVTYISFMA